MTTRISGQSSPPGLHHPIPADELVEPDEGDLLLRVTGIVPPDDFHPFVVRVARHLRLRGWIRHDPAGALIRAVGEEIPLAQLVRALWTDAPPSARIRGLDPDLITADTPPVGDHFIALVEEPVGWADPDPEPSGTPPLAHVA